VADTLAAQGIETGDYVGLMFDSSPSFAASLFALWSLGGVAVPLGPRVTALELAFVMRHSSAAAVVSEPRFESLLATLRLPKGAIVIQPDQLRDGASKTSGLTRQSAGDGSAVCLYTSGTTGTPKAVLLTHSSIAASVCAAQGGVIEGEGRAVACSWPLFHSLGLVQGLLLPISLGGTCVFSDEPAWTNIPRAVRAAGAEVLLATPDVYASMPDLDWTDPPHLPSLTDCVSCGAPLPERVAKRFERTYGVTIRDAFGLTEASSIVSVNPKPWRRLGSVGKALPEIAIRIWGEDGNPVIPGEIGEIVVKGDVVMAGYLGNDQGTEDALVNGWLRTGDLGYKDSDGYLYLSGRKDELIRVAGMKVFPGEVEDVLKDHPDIADVCAVGVPDRASGQVVKAYVIRAEGSHIDEKDVQNICRERLIPNKVPKYVQFVHRLPKTVTGKIDVDALLASDPSFSPA
jgi:long-chain acyl-CoA synthetase